MELFAGVNWDQRRRVASGWKGKRWRSLWRKRKCFCPLDVMSRPLLLLWLSSSQTCFPSLGKLGRMPLHYHCDSNFLQKLCEQMGQERRHSLFLLRRVIIQSTIQLWSNTCPHGSDLSALPSDPIWLLANTRGVSSVAGLLLLAMTEGNGSRQIGQHWAIYSPPVTLFL